MEIVSLLQGIAAWISMTLHSYADAVIVAASLIGFFCLEKKKVFATALVIALVTAFAAKFYYAEPRPCFGEVFCPSDYGFPSLHSTAAGVFALSSAGTPLFYGFLPLSVLLAVTRLYLGVHSLAQVIAGIALGAVAWLALNQFFEARKK